MARERDRHKLPRDVDLVKLRDQLSLRLGRSVEIVARPPDGDNDGELAVTDPDTGDWLKVDPTVVAAAVAVTPAAPDPRTSEQKLLADLNTAVGVDAQLAAIREFLVRAVEADLAIRANQTDTPPLPPGGSGDVPAGQDGGSRPSEQPPQREHLNPGHLLAPWHGLQLGPVLGPG